MISRFIIPLLAISSLDAAPVYIGTNTGNGSESKGIYQADFDSDSGKLTEPKLVAEYASPGFLAIHPAKPILFACGRPPAGGKGSVAAFAIGEDHGLKFLGDSSSGGVGPCHVAVDATGRTLAVANYGDGSFAMLKLGESGIPESLATVINHTGTGPNGNRQDGPHAHGVYFNKANTLLFVPDLGLDQVFVYPFDAANSRLGEPKPSLRSAPGAGPRHMAFSGDEKHIYVINELENSITASGWDGSRFENLGSVPTLPKDFSGTNTTAEIEVHPNGRLVYGSNRGDNSIVVYQRDPASGILTFLQRVPCGGKIPRHFKIDPSGKWLLCAHQDTNTISVLPLDPETGLLGKPAQTVSSPSPICILFGR
jgi:6-phosphogluconolactonase